MAGMAIKSQEPCVIFFSPTCLPWAIHQVRSLCYSTSWAGREMIKGPGWELCPTSSVAAVSVPVARQGHSLWVWFCCSPPGPAGLCWGCVCLVLCPPASIPALCASPAVLLCVRLVPNPLVLTKPLGVQETAGRQKQIYSYLGTD